MNVVNIIGRLTKDAELKGNGDNKVAVFTLAVKNTYKDKDGNYQSSFIDCKAFGSVAERVVRFFHKGNQMGAVGELRQETWEKDGKNYSVLRVFISRVDILDKKEEKQNEEVPQQEERTPNVNDDELPF